MNRNQYNRMKAEFEGATRDMTPGQKAMTVGAVIMEPEVSVDDLLQAIAECRRFIGTSQIECMVDLVRSEEGAWWRQKIVDTAKLFREMPQTYDQDGLGDEAVVHLHYFLGGADWFITEKDKGCDESPGQHQAFGLADLFRDGGELGYISIVEIIRLGAELDLHWTPKTLGEVKEDRRGC